MNRSQRRTLAFAHGQKQRSLARRATRDAHIGTRLRAESNKFIRDPEMQAEVDALKRPEQYLVKLQHQAFLRQIRDRATQLVKAHGSQEKVNIWLAELLASEFGVMGKDKPLAIPEPDCNFSKVYVPRHPAVLEDFFGLRHGSTTQYAKQGWVFGWNGKFVNAKPQPMRPFVKDPLFYGDKCANSSRADDRCESVGGIVTTSYVLSLAYLQTLVREIDAAADAQQFVSSVSQSTALPSDKRAPFGIPVRAVLLDMFDIVPNKDLWTAAALHVAEMLVCVFQYDEVSYSDMLAAIYIVAALAYVVGDINDALLYQLVTMPFVHLPLTTRIGLVRAEIGGPLSNFFNR